MSIVIHLYDDHINNQYQYQGHLSTCVIITAAGTDEGHHTSSQLFGEKAIQG